MRNIEASPWLESPGLVEVKAANVDKRRVSEFNLNLSLKRASDTPPAAAPGKDGAKPAAQDPAKPAAAPAAAPASAPAAKKG